MSELSFGIKRIVFCFKEKDVVFTEHFCFEMISATENQVLFENRKHDYIDFKS